MKKYILLLIVIIIVIASGIVYYQKSASKLLDGQPVVIGDSIVGCYVAHLSKDVYTLSVLSEDGEKVKGTLAFKNFEKDSSRGTFVGTYKDGILLGEYSFQSEGMDSVMQVVFKKSGTGFIRGYGPMNATGDRFANMNDVTYDSSVVFKASSEGCAVATATPPAPVIPKGKLTSGSAPAPTAKDIQLQTWVWQSSIMSDGTLISPKKAGSFSILLSSDGRVTGKTDCNGFFGSYKLGTDGVISWGPMASTKMFCEGSQESVFTDQVTKSDRYALDSSGNLVLRLARNGGSIVFKKS